MNIFKCRYYKDVIKFYMLNVVHSTIILFYFQMYVHNLLTKGSMLVMYFTILHRYIYAECLSQKGNAFSFDLFLYNCCSLYVMNKQVCNVN